MSNDRRQHLRRLLAADGQADLRVDRICDACVTALDISGAGVTVLSKAPGSGSEHHRGLVHASDPVSARLEDLQLTVGEGPCVDAFATGGPILVPDLAAALSRWPAFGSGAAGLGAAAVFSFPLQVGVVRLGSLDLYRDRPGLLTHEQVTDALLLADLATQAVVDQLDGHATSDLTWLADSHVEIHQAVGMVKIQLDATTDVALLRLRGYAFSQGLTLSHVARQVVARTLRFTPTEEPA
ncbi:GAF and ANTAR domain-containing protein [Amycolatopsis sp. OK19-0408]|uniref:GAF and ANTAR domain-containing protein n=1 Tax=Amycolatopsis iheyensis TaxID=2945988 RepID=A0A9X2SPX2_9PSEU|nr:GAF and ANTAR domain-containing protein [Amycolatopsis iheyensis]MCR6490657.1 GAF and ANTAR domain-containing protein [Amycolatopsis iheyensis]